MKTNFLQLILKSLLFYRKSSVYQAVIVLVLTAIITGSLLTGYSVRKSLKTFANQHLGNTDILISSGLRYFDDSLAVRIKGNIGGNCVPIIESDGYCQNFSTGKTALNIKIYTADSGFFPFHGNDSINILPGSVAINQNLANLLNIKTGEEIVIHFREVSPIPANSPFARSGTNTGTKVLLVSRIINAEQSGNFSLGISQITPLNVYINKQDLTSNETDLRKSNRLLVQNSKKIPLADLKEVLKGSILPGDFGLTLRKTEISGGSEVISDRIFIDQDIIAEITRVIPSAQPVLTYLANSFRHNKLITPYSFVSALPGEIYPEISRGNNIVINKWMAEDLDAKVKDTIHMSWYSPLTNGKLDEVSSIFIVSRIVDLDGIWADPSLMPEFPGIAGSISCSDWDAGIPLNMKMIRKKDESYWNNYRGTPKAFLEYTKGKELWGNNFGPATAIRFPESISKKEIENSLNGNINPEAVGFSVRDIRSESDRSASEGVDFSTLFLSLGFFIIVSCFVLLILSVSVYFDSRKDHINTFFALGFTDKWIERLLFTETSVIAISGAIPGVFAGGITSWFIIAALNSVWQGAVQTSNISSHLAFLPLISGFIITIIIVQIILKIKVRRFLRSIKKADTGIFKKQSSGINLFLSISFLIISAIVIVCSLLFREYSTSLSFAGGTMMFVSIILIVKLFYIGGLTKRDKKLTNQYSLSRLYYSFHPSHAVTPIIFIAAGIFAVFITGVNRLDINDKMNEPSGGTGGFLLWSESVVPVKEDLNSRLGRKAFGLDDGITKSLTFVQAKRSQGDDASCLNLNHVTAPPLLGLDPSEFIRKGSFSFASVMKGIEYENPWESINRPEINNTVYGIADQTVLQWGLKITTGDTIILRSENGMLLNVIIAGGLKSSVFQGFLIIGADNFNKYYPSVAGSNVFLANAAPEFSETYQNVLRERFVNYGFLVMPASERLASFFEVTNTYLSVFTVMGAFGMILGVVGLGFILLRNYNHRKREFALMMATGYNIASLRKMIKREQIQILSAGIFTGVVSALFATLPSLKSGSEIPWIFLIIMILSVFLIGMLTLSLSIRSVRHDSLLTGLRKE
jgi:putative ABC transport system permease protein